jgi:hypothetical protein
MLLHPTLRYVIICLLSLQGLADLLMEEHQTAQVARPGTSLARPTTTGASPVRFR